MIVQHITWQHSTSHRITSHHTTSHHVTHHITIHDAISHHITSRHVTSHHITWYLATNCIASPRVQPHYFIHVATNHMASYITSTPQKHNQPQTNNATTRRNGWCRQKNRFFGSTTGLSGHYWSLILESPDVDFWNSYYGRVFFVVACQFLIPKVLFQLFAGGENLQLRWRKIFWMAHNLWMVPLVFWFKAAS